MIEVVTAVLIEDHRVLLCQRSGGRDHPFTWETPGGKVDAGEKPIDAMIRELHEELALRVISWKRTALWDGVLDAGTCGHRPRSLEIRLSMWRVWAVGPVVLRDHAGLGWFHVEQLARLDLAPGNRAALAALQEEMLHHAPETGPE